MAGEIYRPFIEDMTWSYSRIKAFTDCPYKWFRQYIQGEEEKPMFYSSYGSFMHSLLARFYTGELDRNGMRLAFLADFSSEVQGTRPAAATVEKYITQGLRYIETFEPFPFEVIGVEQEVFFDFAGYPFHGFVDIIGKQNDAFIIVDHKSRELKPRTKRSKPTQKDLELDDMLIQLYVYSEALKTLYGAYPERLCFNCFRNGTFVEEPFNLEGLRRAENWARTNINFILNATEFYPQYDFFSCYNLCGLYEDCEYYQMMKKR